MIGSGRNLLQKVVFYLNAKKQPIERMKVFVFYDKPRYTPQMTEGHSRKVSFKRKELNSDVYNENTSDVSTIRQALPTQYTGYKTRYSEI